MVGLADIPCVGKVVDRISDAAVDPIFRGFRYMFRYKDLVKTLNSQVEKANTEEERVSRKVAAERANGKIIEKNVLDWQKEAEKIKESAQEFAERYENRQSWRCIQSLPIPNPVSRFRLGREAVKKTERLTELINSGNELLADEIAHLAPNENLPKSTTEFQDFQSRKDTYAELWQALTTDSSPILGIYGMPGVGKTMMMEQIWKEAHEKNVFDKVTRANVGNEKLDVIQLQKQIAGHLGCTFDSEDNAESRASQLKQSLLNAGKTLVILDDVWTEIPLDVIGIPCGDGNSPMGSKILLTSREKDACLHNNCKTPVKIKPLSNDEAWDQFSAVVGTARFNSLQEESLAKNVCKKCKGLPLLIHAVGKALKFKLLSSWVDALEQLENGKFEKISGIDPEVYVCVKLSIDQLPDDAKSCLFLCCLFNEDADIRISHLIQLATGSQLVSGESRVLSMVDTLRSSSLLLDCEEDDSIKLHDVIRDVGRSIAFRDPKYAFSQVTCGVRLLEDADFVTTKFLRLDLDGDNIIPDDLVCPDLHSLWMLCNNYIQQFSGGFFSMCSNMRFLYVNGFPLCPSKLLFTLQSLGKLRTLVFNFCDLRHLTHMNNKNVGFFPENLQTLCILYGHLPEPLDLSNLKYLRKLEIKGLVVRMMPNTISSLSRLEELHIPDGFEIWHDDSSAVAKPILVEINNLTHLKSLQIQFEISEPFQNTNIFDNLTLFNIRVGGLDYKGEDLSYKTSVELEDYREESLNSLIKKAEYVSLKRTDINVISNIFDSNREAFTELRKLYIEECNKMEYLARMSQGEIQHSQPTSFSNLTCLEIKECFRLRYLFCNSVAKCLTQLQKLIIRDCPAMEAIVMNDGSSSGDIIHYSNLEELELSKVPRLRSFCSENKDAMMQPSAQFQPLFHEMVEFPSLKDLKIENVEDISDIWERDYNCESSFCKLTSISVQGSSRLETIIPVVMLHKLSNLQSLRITDCSALISEVGTDAKNIDVRRLPALSHLYLNGLPCLTETGDLYPNLKKLEVNDCHSLTNLVPRDVMHLEEIIVGNCKKMKRIVGGAKQGEINDVLVFPELTCLRLELLPNLTSFSGEETDARKVEFPNIVKLEIISCEEIKLELIEFSIQLKSLNIRCDNQIQLPSTWQPRLQNLETLVLRKCWWHDLKSLRFHRLKLLGVLEYSGCSALFTFSGFRSLQHLQALLIFDCAFLEEIAEDDEMSGMNKKTIMLPRLQMVVLKNLPKLKSIIHGVNYGWLVPYLREVDVENCGLSNLFSFSELTSLKTLKISRCADLEEIVEDEVSGMNKKTITLSQLESVTLEDLPKLKSLIYSANHECLLPNLYNVSVSNCGLSSLFMCSASGSLQSLRDLKVQDCRLLEDIIKYARGDENSGTTEQIIVSLSKLGSLELKNLPALKSFIHGANYDCQMPALWKMEVDNCGFSTPFTCSVFRNLPQLQYLRVSNCRMLEGIFEYASGDETSGTTEQIIISLPKLRSLALRNLAALKNFIHGANYDCYMPALWKMEVDNCGFSTLFTCSVLRTLQQLKYLKVSNCSLLEVVVEEARGEETSDKTITLPWLLKMELENLPNLKSFSRDESIAFNMPALEKIHAENCGFSTLFTCSVFRNLQELQNLTVSKCRLLEVIVEDARGEETSDTYDKTITLPQLENFILEHLPNLKSFSRDQSIGFNMPKLGYFHLVGCPRAENFSCLNTHTGEGRVGTDGDEWRQVPDLNDYIKTLFEQEDVAVPEMKRIVGQ